MLCVRRSLLPVTQMSEHAVEDPAERHWFHQGIDQSCILYSAP